MIDLTPLDIRNKRGDFKRLMRGYDPHEVDVFLELAADRLEVLVRENLQLKERTQSLEEQVSAQTGREQAVQDALVTAQELRADIHAQSQREAELMLREAEAKGRRLIVDAESEARRVIRDAEGDALERVRELDRRIEHASTSIQELERRRVRFLKEFRGLLARELNVVEVEEDKLPFEERAIDLDLGAGAARGASRQGRSGTPADVQRASAPPEDDPEATWNRAEEGSASEARDMSPGSFDPATDVGRSDTDVPPSGPEGATTEAEVATTEADVETTDPHVTTKGADAMADPGGVVSENVSTQTRTPMPPPPAGPPPLPEAGRGSAGPGALPPHPVFAVPQSGGDRGSMRDPVPSRSDAPEPVDVADLSPENRASTDARTTYADVPDFETLLAEAGIDEVKPPPLSEAPPTREGRDSFILFDVDDPSRDD